MKKRNKRQKRLLYVIATSGLTLLLIMVVGGPLGEIHSGDGIVVGYCPTMEGYAQEHFGEEHIIDMRSTGNALKALERGEIDAAMTGRKARTGEISYDVEEKMLESGSTLITRIQRQIHRNELNGMTIHTHIDLETAENLIPEADIKHYDDMETAKRKGIDEAVLVGWEEISGDYELLVVYDGILKDERFRTPFIYKR